jgi:transposase-like protein
VKAKAPAKAPVKKAPAKKPAKKIAVKRKPAITVAPARHKLDVAGEQVIIDMITRGAGYRAIAREHDVSIGSLFAWINGTSERSHACANARELASYSEDELALDDIELATNQFDLAKAREMAIHRRWRAKILNPRKYGDKVALEHSGNVNIKTMSDADLLTVAAQGLVDAE